jgi:HEAT repeat protein
MMKKTLNNIEDKELQKLLNELGDKSDIKRKNARKALVAKGKKSIDFLIELLSHPKHIYRWEAVKALEEIADPDTVSILIQTMEDDKSDVRWIAAKALVNIGKPAIKPLLKTLIDKSDCVFVLEGAHHVFYDLHEKGMLPADFPSHKLLSALKNPEWVDSVKPLAYEILDKLKS